MMEKLIIKGFRDIFNQLRRRKDHESLAELRGYAAALLYTDVISTDAFTKVCNAGQMILFGKIYK
jgi:hypothetical protein